MHIVPLRHARTTQRRFAVACSHAFIIYIRHTATLDIPAVLFHFLFRGNRFVRVKLLMDCILARIRTLLYIVSPLYVIFWINRFDIFFLLVGYVSWFLVVNSHQLASFGICCRRADMSTTCSKICAMATISFPWWKCSPASNL